MFGSRPNRRIPVRITSMSVETWSEVSIGGREEIGVDNECKEQRGG